MAGRGIAIMDYGVGNLKSVSNALAYLGLSHCITQERGVLEQADAILLPGVGAFPDAMEQLRMRGLDQVLHAMVGKKPLLGICLGMQLLFEHGTEGRPCEGLGWIGGSVSRIETREKLPHIGWNALHFPRISPLFQGVPEGAYVYFVHSFCGRTSRPETVLATTDYGTEVTAAVGDGLVFGTQFHPEKSGEVGLQILKNFGEMSR